VLTNARYSVLVATRQENMIMISTSFFFLEDLFDGILRISSFAV
jgi:hypothetical protein